MNWYYSKNGVQLGPIAEEELVAKSRSGEVSATDLIWKEGMTDWRPLGEVDVFMGVAGAAMVPPPSPVGSVPMQQPAAYNPSQMPGTIPNYLWQAIAVTVLCCMPFGVVSIVYAAKVDGLVAQGDLAGAAAASKTAKTWAIAGFASFLVVVVIYLVIFGLAAASGNLN